jgi:hypothetical protein
MTSTTSAPSNTPGKAHGNPYLDHIDRAPYELGKLFKSIPADFSEFEEQTPETYLRLEATITHANNGNTTLMSGLESLGVSLFAASVLDGFEVGNSHLGNTGCLIQHIAVEAQLLQETMD